MNPAELEAQRSQREGLLASLIAYVLWGLFPIYFILVASVAPLEVLANRIIWAVPFGALILYFRRQGRAVGDGSPDQPWLLHQSFDVCARRRGVPA